MSLMSDGYDGPIDYSVGPNLAERVSTIESKILVLQKELAATSAIVDGRAIGRAVAEERKRLHAEFSIKEQDFYIQIAELKQELAEWKSDPDRQVVKEVERVVTREVEIDCTRDHDTSAAFTRGQRLVVGTVAEIRGISFEEVTETLQKWEAHKAAHPTTGSMFDKQVIVCNCSCELCQKKCPITTEIKE